MRLPLLLLAALSFPAHADTDKGPGALEAQIAGKLYEGNNYREAAPHFVKAYELDPQPAYLFDAAQAYRFAKDCANAAKYYRQFLDVAKQVKAENLDKVKHYITEMDECAKPAAPPVPAHTEPTPPPQPAEQPLPAGPEPHVSDPGATTRHVGIAVTAVGVVGLGVAGYYWKKVQDLNNDQCHKTPLTCTNLAQENNEGETRDRIWIASSVVGGAALVGGIVLYVLGHNQSTEPAVSIAPTRTGAMLSFTF